MNGRSLKTVSVIIPTLQAGESIAHLLTRLGGQTLPPTEIIVIDSSSTDETVETARDMGCVCEVIPKSSFNHGGTRNSGARLASGDVLVFMTQDALPFDETFLEELTRPIREGRVVAAYARQIPYPDAPPPEVYARCFNYPARSHTRKLGDVEQLGVKAFFFSNVASAVSRDAFWELGAFPESVILSEDMLLCAKVLRTGGAVSYCAEAKVYHSHNYGIINQFKRYFDIGVAMAQAHEVLDGARVGGEGARFALGQLNYLLRNGEWTWIFRSLIESAAKIFAFQAGRFERYIPQGLKKKMSMHAYYWDAKPDQGLEQ